MTAALTLTLASAYLLALAALARSWAARAEGGRCRVWWERLDPRR